MLKMQHVCEPYSTYTQRYRLAQPRLCPVSISYVTPDKDMLQIEEGISTRNEEMRGRRTRLQHRHWQFALSGLTGSVAETELRRGLLLGSYATNDERKSP